MSLTPEEAAQSLKEIEQTSRSSASALGYTRSSYSFMIWGTAWIVGYTGTDLLWRVGRPNFIWLLWVTLAFAGSCAEAFFIRRRYYEGRSGAELARARSIGRRAGATVLIVYVFVAATMAVMQPRNPWAIGAFIPLVLATYYAVMGIWTGARFIAVGAALAALTVGGFFLLGNYFLLWMAAVGGGSLILVAFWMKRL